MKLLKLLKKKDYFKNSDKLASKALAMFDKAINGLEKANAELEKGGELLTKKHMDIEDTVKELKSKQQTLKTEFEEHKEAFNKNLAHIEKLKKFFE